MEPLLFYADEHLRQRTLRRMLDPHLVEFLALQTRDPAIVMAAEQSGAIIITADTWFYNHLRQGDYHNQKLMKSRGGVVYENAGVILVAGEWSFARLQLTRWLPLIATVAEIQSGVPKRRVVVSFGKHQTIQIDL